MPEPPNRAYEIAAATISEREYVNFMTKFMQVLQRDTVVKCYVSMQVCTKNNTIFKIIWTFDILFWSTKKRDYDFRKNKILNKPPPPQKNL